MTGADGLGVSCEGVSCVYPSRRGDVRALEQLSFDVRGHAFVSIVLNAVLQWAARRGAPWLSERELTV